MLATVVIDSLRPAGDGQVAVQATVEIVGLQRPATAWRCWPWSSSTSSAGIGLVAVQAAVVIDSLQAAGSGLVVLAIGIEHQLGRAAGRWWT